MFRIDPYDLVFVLCAVAFELLIIAIFIATRHNAVVWRTRFGVAWLCLGIPLFVVFVRYAVTRRDLMTMIYFSSILGYMLVELFLDYVFKVEFRERAITHVPYIILEYIALFSLIGISFDIHQTWGWIVAACFWLLMGSLIYLYWPQISARWTKK